jgi:hypothetical protein
MRIAAIAAVSVVGGLAFVVLFAWLTWNYVFGPVDRVFWASMFGFGSLGGQ